MPFSFIRTFTSVLMTIPPLPADSDEELLARMARGDNEAFYVFYLRYKDAVFNTCLAYLQHPEDAEEITQDVFLTVHQKAFGFQGKSRVATWVYRIAINQSLNKLQQRRRQNIFSHAYAQTPDVADFRHPGILLENREKAAYLFQAIQSLADAQKTAFILCYIEALPQQEVADIMDLSLKAVESLLQRAKKKLRKKIISRYPEGN